MVSTARQLIVRRSTLCTPWLVFMQVLKAAICSSTTCRRSSATWNWRKCSCRSVTSSAQRSTSTAPPARASASVSQPLLSFARNRTDGKCTRKLRTKYQGWKTTGAHGKCSESVNAGFFSAGPFYLAYTSRPVLSCYFGSSFSSLAFSGPAFSAPQEATINDKWQCLKCRPKSGIQKLPFYSKGGSITRSALPSTSSARFMDAFDRS